MVNNNILFEKALRDNYPYSLNGGLLRIELTIRTSDDGKQFTDDTYIRRTRCKTKWYKQTDVARNVKKGYRDMRIMSMYPYTYYELSLYRRNIEIIRLHKELGTDKWYITYVNPMRASEPVLYSIYVHLKGFKASLLPLKIDYGRILSTILRDGYRYPTFSIVSSDPYIIKRAIVNSPINSSPWVHCSTSNIVLYEFLRRGLDPVDKHKEWVGIICAHLASHSAKDRRKILVEIRKYIYRYIDPQLYRFLDLPKFCSCVSCKKYVLTVLTREINRIGTRARKARQVLAVSVFRSFEKIGIRLHDKKVKSIKRKHPELFTCMSCDNRIHNREMSHQMVMYYIKNPEMKTRIALLCCQCFALAANGDLRIRNGQLYNRLFPLDKNESSCTNE